MKSPLIEISGRSGSGKTEFVLRQLFQRCEGTARIAWIDPSSTTYPQAFPLHQVDLSMVLFISPTQQDLAWTVLQVLRSQLFAHVVVTEESQCFSEVDLRRVQLAAERSGARVYLIREWARGQGTWAISEQVRLARNPQTGDLQETWIKSRKFKGNSASPGIALEA